MKNMLNNDVKGGLKSIGSFLLYKYSNDTKNFGNVFFRFKIDSDYTITLSRHKYNEAIKIEDKFEKLIIHLKWKRNNSIGLEKGITTLLNLSGFAFTKLLELQEFENNLSEH